MKRKAVVLPLVGALAAVGLISNIQVASSQFLTAASSAARDPGVRFGPAGAGDPVAGLTATERAFFDSGLADFSSTETIADGLGPRMNMDSCSGCHAQPAV